MGGENIHDDNIQQKERKKKYDRILKLFVYNGHNICNGYYYII